MEHLKRTMNINTVLCILWVLQNPLASVIPFPSSFQWLTSDLNSRMSIWGKSGFKKHVLAHYRKRFLCIQFLKVILGKECTCILWQLDKQVNLWPFTYSQLFPGIWSSAIDYIPIVYFFLFFSKEYEKFLPNNITARNWCCETGRLPHAVKIRLYH